MGGLVAVLGELRLGLSLSLSWFVRWILSLKLRCPRDRPCLLNGDSRAGWCTLQQAQLHGVGSGPRPVVGTRGRTAAGADGMRSWYSLVGLALLGVSRQLMGLRWCRRQHSGHQASLCPAGAVRDRSGNQQTEKLAAAAEGNLLLLLLLMSPCPC